MAVPADANSVLCRILGRYKFYVDARDVGFGAHLQLDGAWETHATYFMMHAVQPEMVCYDVGANHGYFTVLLADLVGLGGKVRAFEPNPRLAALARRNIWVNGFDSIASLDERAVAETSKRRVVLTATFDEPKHGIIGDATGAPLITSAELLQADVETLALDDLENERVDFIKIDVEGAEELVWAGMQRLLDRNPHLMMLLEYNPRRCRDPGGFLDAIADRFPLRMLDFNARLRPISKVDALASAHDVLLYLRADE